MLPERELEKTKQDLLELHKRVLTDYLIREGLSYKNRKKFFFIYDHYINWRNIHLYFNAPCKIFVKALIKDKLQEIQWIGPAKKEVEADNVPDLILALQGKKPRRKKKKTPRKTFSF